MLGPAGGRCKRRQAPSAFRRQAKQGDDATAWKTTRLAALFGIRQPIMQAAGLAKSLPAGGPVEALVRETAAAFSRLGG